MIVLGNITREERNMRPFSLWSLCDWLSHYACLFEDIVMKYYLTSYNLLFLIKDRDLFTSIL